MVGLNGDADELSGVGLNGGEDGGSGEMNEDGRGSEACGGAARRIIPQMWTSAACIPTARGEAGAYRRGGNRAGGGTSESHRHRRMRA